MEVNRLLSKKWVKNNRAFTLVEIVFALGIMLLSVNLLYHVTPVLSTYHRRLHHQTMLDVVRFRTQIERHFAQEYYISHTNDQVVTKHKAETFYYEQYQNMIRRKSQRGGHEPLLMGVATFHIEKQPNYIRVTVTMENNERYGMNVFISQKETDI